MKKPVICFLCISLAALLSACVTGSEALATETESISFPTVDTTATAEIFMPVTDTPESTQMVVAEAPTEAAPTPSEETLPTPEGYPATPEDVVSAFLRAYQEDANLMFQYLTPALQSQLPAEGITEVLAFDGVLEGFAIQSGSSGATPEMSVVTVNVQINGVGAQRNFYLTLVNQMWQIDAIEII